MAVSPRSAVALTATEWRSFIASGILRISRRRVQFLQQPPTTNDFDRLFSWAPTTVLGDGNDVLVIELHPDWYEISASHSSQPTELVILPIAAVHSHQAVGKEFNDYLSVDAEKEGVALSHGVYDRGWIDWVEKERSDYEVHAAVTLMSSLGLSADLGTPRDDGYQWRDVIRLARNTKIDRLVETPSHLDDLLRRAREIGTTVAGVHDSLAYELAVNIEWIAARLDTDPLDSNEISSALNQALEMGRGIARADFWSQAIFCEELLEELAQRFPSAFTGEITPFTVPGITRLVTEAKARTLDPNEFRATVRKHPNSAVTMCAIVAGALGSHLTNRLSSVLRDSDVDSDEVPTAVRDTDSIHDLSAESSVDRVVLAQSADSPSPPTISEHDHFQGDQSTQGATTSQTTENEQKKPEAMRRSEHHFSCSYYGEDEEKNPPETCELCDKLEAPVWFTKSGYAFHVNKDCPSLHEKRTTPVIERKWGSKPADLQGCHQCVNGICVSCSAGSHKRCNPEKAGLDHCKCPCD